MKYTIPVTALLAVCVAGLLVFITAPRHDNSLILAVLDNLPWKDDVIPPDSWVEWIYDFQSLIGGIFAVVAAFITVSQMRASDDKAESRHYDLVSRQDEVARNRAERFINPGYEELCQQEDRINSLIPRIQNDFSTDLNGADSILHNIRHTLRRPQFRAAEDLLDGSAAAGHNKLLLALPEALEAHDDLFQAIRTRQGRQQKANDELGVQFREITVGLKELIAGLERVAKRHAIELRRPRNNFINNNDVTVSSTATHQ